MANRRQRKKQQTKQNIALFQAANKPKSYIKQNRNNIREAKKVQRNITRKNIANERSRILQSFGYKVTGDVAKMRYWGQARWDEWYKKELKKREREKKKKEKKLKDLQDNYLLIFWRDKTAEGFADYDLIDTYKHSYRYASVSELIRHIDYFLRTQDAKGMEIGTTASMVVDGRNRNQYVRFMQNMSDVSSQLTDSNDWALVYSGKAKRYKELLIAIVTVIRLLYDHTERSDFIQTLMFKTLPQVNIQMAKRLAGDLRWRSI